MLLARHLHELGHCIACPNGGPDFRFDLKGTTVWVEAVSPTPVGLQAEWLFSAFRACTAFLMSNLASLDHCPRRQMEEASGVPTEGDSGRERRLRGRHQRLSAQPISRVAGHHADAFRRRNCVSGRSARLPGQPGDREDREAIYLRALPRHECKQIPSANDALRRPCLWRRKRTDWLRLRSLPRQTAGASCRAQSPRGGAAPARLSRWAGRRMVCLASDRKDRRIRSSARPSAGRSVGPILGKRLFHQLLFFGVSYRPLQALTPWRQKFFGRTVTHCRVMPRYLALPKTSMVFGGINDTARNRIALRAGISRSTTSRQERR
jgi:hypothetical protein